MDWGSFGGSRCCCSYECCPFRGTAPPVVMPKWWVTGSFAPSWTGYCWGSSSDGLPVSLLFSAGPWGRGEGINLNVRAYFAATLVRDLAHVGDGMDSLCIIMLSFLGVAMSFHIKVHLWTIRILASNGKYKFTKLISRLERRRALQTALQCKVPA